MSDLEPIECPECDERFNVIWCRSATSGDGPMYCPFCGEDLEDFYRENTKARDDE